MNICGFCRQPRRLAVNFSRDEVYQLVLAIPSSDNTKSETSFRVRRELEQMRNDAQAIRHTVAKYGIPLVIILRRLSVLLQLDKHMTCGLLQESLQPHEIG